MSNSYCQEKSNYFVISIQKCNLDKKEEQHMACNIHWFTIGIYH